MPVAEIEIINKLGLHARASAKLSQLAAQFPCEILLSRTLFHSGRKIWHLKLLMSGKTKSARALQNHSERWSCCGTIGEEERSF